MAAARKKRAHQVVAKALLKAVADLHPDVALEALAPFYARERDGTRRRAIRAVRITLMHKAIEAPPRVILPVVEPVPEPEPPEPEIVTEPPAPKPVPKGKLLSVSLEDAAKLLFVAPEPEPEAPPAAASAPEAEAPAEPEFAPIDWAAAAAGLSAFDMPDEPEVVTADLPVMMLAPSRTPILEMMDEAAEEPAEDPAAEAEVMAPTPPKRGKKAAKADLPDLSAQFAALSGEGMDEVAPPKAVTGLDEGLRALQGLEEAVPVAAPALMIDPAAAFAAMAEEEPAKARTKAQMVDPASAFAAMEAADSPAPPAAKAPVMMADPAAAFAAMEAAEDEAAQAVGKGTGKPKPLTIDLSAQFAAMADEDDGTKKAV